MSPKRKNDKMPSSVTLKNRIKESINDFLLTQLYRVLYSVSRIDGWWITVPLLQNNNPCTFSARTKNISVSDLKVFLLANPEKFESFYVSICGPKNFLPNLLQRNNNNPLTEASGQRKAKAEYVLPSKLIWGGNALVYGALQVTQTGRDLPNLGFHDHHTFTSQRFWSKIWTDAENYPATLHVVILVAMFFPLAGTIAGVVVFAFTWKQNQTHSYTETIFHKPRAILGSQKGGGGDTDKFGWLSCS